MKKRSKQLLTILALLLAFSLVFAGCAKDNDRDDRDRDEQEELLDNDRNEDQAGLDEDEGKIQVEGEDETDIVVSVPTYRMESVDLLTEEYYYNDDDDLVSVNYYTYDEYGKLIERSSLNGEGKVNSRSVYEYDAAGNRISTMVYGSDGSLSSTYTYTYDAKGLCTSEVLDYVGTDLVLTTVYEYDAEGYLIRELETDADGNFRNEVVYTFNADHTERYTERFDADKEGNRHANGGGYDLYDANGNLIYWCTYGSFGDNMVSKDDPAYVGEHFYDENGRLVEKTYSELGGYIVSKDVLTYDESGNLIRQERIYIRTGNCLNWYEYTYETFEIKVEGN